MKITIKSHDIVNFVIKDLLYPHECDQIINSLSIRELEEHTSEIPKTIDSGIFKVQEWTDVRVMKKYVLKCVLLQYMLHRKILLMTYFIFSNKVLLWMKRMISFMKS